MKLFDLHSDTPYRMYHEALSITDPRLDCRLPELCQLEKAVQVAAIWSDPRKPDRQNYEDFFRIVTHFRDEIERNDDLCRLIFPQFSGKLTENRPTEPFERGKSPLTNKIKDSQKADTEDTRVGYILAVEGGTLLENDPCRLESLYAYGVRIFLPTWNEPSGYAGRIGGAHNTQKPFTPFGEAVLRECDRLGILIDYSHASEQAFWQTVDRKSAASLPPLFSHSNSFCVTPSTRNITDRQFQGLIERGGLCGINWYPPFCGKYDPSDPFGGVVRHILHFRKQGGIRSIALGADRDGIDPIRGYTSVSELPKLYERLVQEGLSTDEIDAIFYQNAAERLLGGGNDFS